MSRVHAVRIHKNGGPEELRYEEVEIGEPGPGEARVRHTAIGLNFTDVHHRTGRYPLPQFPHVIGMETAGVVEAVGAGVTEIRPGDRVAYASEKPRSYSQATVMPIGRLVTLPDFIDDETAAAVILKGLTAQYLIRSAHPVSAGETILIQAAAGGVGLIMCQWAAALGATVIGTVGTQEKAELARAHGCTHPIVYSQQDFVAEVARITDGEKLPVVYDSVGRDTFLKSLDCLKVRGLMVSFGNASGAPEPFPPNMLAQKGSLYLTRPTLYHYIASRQQLEQSAGELFDMVTGGKVKIEVQQRFPLAEAAEAHRALQARKTTGSTVLTI